MKEFDNKVKQIKRAIEKRSYLEHVVETGWGEESSKADFELSKCKIRISELFSELRYMHILEKLRK